MSNLLPYSELQDEAIHAFLHPNTNAATSLDSITRNAWKDPDSLINKLEWFHID